MWYYKKLIWHYIPAKSCACLCVLMFVTQVFFVVVVAGFLYLPSHHLPSMAEFRADKGVGGSGGSYFMGLSCQIGSKSFLWFTGVQKESHNFSLTSGEEMTEAHLDHTNSQRFNNCSCWPTVQVYTVGKWAQAVVFWIALWYLSCLLPCFPATLICFC